MNKDKLDRIIVESNNRMQKVIDWYLGNKDWLDKEEFHAPMESGCIVLKEEGLEVTFLTKEADTVEIAVYPLDSPIPFITYDYNPESQTYSNYKYPANISAVKRQLMETVLKIDRMDYKEAIKYHSLMMFATYYKDIVVVDETKGAPQSKHVPKRYHKSVKRPAPLVRRTYIVADFEAAGLGKKRRYTKPGHEVQVRGYFRTTKTGKRAWVKPFVKYKGKGDAETKEYTI